MSGGDQRVLLLDGVHNFRDFGGYGVAGGGRLKRGVLWSSGQHHGASPADLIKIDALGLAAVFDLRSAIEREHYPCARPSGFAARVVFSEDTAMAPGQVEEVDGQMAPHIAAAIAAGHGLERATDAASARQRMLQTYQTFPFRRALVAMVRRYMTELAQTDGPSLVNCMAGKDRTGIAVAMVQRALGVHRDDIVADYLLTNTAGDPQARIEAGRRTIAVVSGDLAPEALEVIMRVEPEWLDAAFDAVAQSHGSVDAYLAQALGADAAVREGLRERLVEG